MTSSRVCTVCADNAEYVGDELDGVYYEAAFGAGGWYASGIVDSESGSFCDALFTDIGPYPTEAEALTAACAAAKEWCIHNGVEWEP